jgi:hypothetical protein
MPTRAGVEVISFVLLISAAASVPSKEPELGVSESASSINLPTE